MRGTRKLKPLHAKLEVSLPEGKCSRRLCRPGARSCGEHTRMRGTWKLKSLHAKPETSLPESKCSFMPCPPRGLSSRTIPFYYPGEGVWGLAPMLAQGP